MKSKFNVWPFLLLTPLLLAGGCDILEKESAPEEILSEEHSHEDSNIETFYTCPMHPQIREPKTGKCPICHMPLVKIEVDRGEGVSQEKPKKDHWRCKDYPEVTSLKEDVCPIDGTPMIQASSQSPGEVVGKVKLRQAQMSHFRPSYFQVAPMKMEKNVRLLGAVLPSEERESNIPARVPGRVEKVYIESTGSFVQEGEPVVDIYSPQLITGGEEYLLAKKNYAKKPSQSFKEMLGQSVERLKLWGIKEWQMERWHRQGKIPRAITIYSPGTGVVQKRNAVTGKYFKEGENFFELTELSSVWVEMDVYEHDSAMVELGQEVILRFTALPGLQVTGEIDFISPVIDPASRTLKVRTTIKNPNGRLKPGMVADSILNIQVEGMPLVVPRSAIIDTGKRKVVWIKISEDTFQAKIIKTGFESQGYVEVLDGLSAGEEVALEANFLLDAQAQLFGGYEDFNDSPEPPAGHQH